MKKRKNKISRGESLLLVIIGLFLGTVFTFGNQYWNADVKQSDTVQKEAIFASYREIFGKGYNTKGIYVYFLDYDQLYIDGTCVNEKLRADLNDIEPGTRVTLMLHPNSDTILDMRIEEYVILEFDTTQDKINKESDAFFVMGLIHYAMAIYGIANLIPRRKRKQDGFIRKFQIMKQRKR